MFDKTKLVSSIGHLRRHTTHFQDRQKIRARSGLPNAGYCCYRSHHPEDGIISLKSRYQTGFRTATYRHPYSSIISPAAISSSTSCCEIRAGFPAITISSSGCRIDGAGIVVYEALLKHRSDLCPDRAALSDSSPSFFHSEQMLRYPLPLPIP